MITTDEHPDLVNGIELYNRGWNEALEALLPDIKKAMDWSDSKNDGYSSGFILGYHKAYEEIANDINNSLKK